MPRIDNTRKARFRAALIRANLTQEQWADRNGMVREHLNRVLNGHVLSRPVTEKIDGFTEEIEAHIRSVA